MCETSQGLSSSHLLITVNFKPLHGGELSDLFSGIKRFNPGSNWKF